MTTRPHQQIPPRSMAGFSLLEIIVAIAIFSIISLVVFFTMDQYFNTAEVLNRRHAKVGDTHRFLHMIERDIQYAIKRPIRGQYGELEGALLVEPIEGNEILSLTSSLPDYANPDSSKLFRVSWTFHDEVIRRNHWQVLDRAQDSTPIRHKILTGVKNIELNLLGNDKSAASIDQPVYPYIELTLYPKQGATINRIIRLSGEL